MRGGATILVHLSPLAGRGRRATPGEGDYPRAWHPWHRQPLTPTLSPQERGEGVY